MYVSVFFFFSSRRRHTRCALVTGVQTCALPILEIAAKSVVRIARSRAEQAQRRLLVERIVDTDIEVELVDDLQICPEIVVESRRRVDARVLVRIRRREGREVRGDAGSATGDGAAFGADNIVGFRRLARKADGEGK